MANAIIRQFSRDTAKAFLRGDTSFNSFGKVFEIECVTNGEYRVITSDGRDTCLRFVAHDRKISFKVA